MDATAIAGRGGSCVLNMGGGAIVQAQVHTTPLRKKMRHGSIFTPSLVTKNGASCSAAQRGASAAGAQAQATLKALLWRHTAAPVYAMQLAAA